MVGPYGGNLWWDSMVGPSHAGVFGERPGPYGGWHVLRGAQAFTHGLCSAQVRRCSVFRDRALCEGALADRGCPRAWGGPAPASSLGHLQPALAIATTACFLHAPLRPSPSRSLNISPRLAVPAGDVLFRSLRKAGPLPTGKAVVGRPAGSGWRRRLRRGLGHHTTLPPQGRG